MPILDGGAATAIIRQVEMSRQTQYRSAQPDDMPRRGKSRVPIFAISASLVEDKRQEYMETGFDGWLLKPVDFKRLQALMDGIEDEELRKQEIYKPGQWEIGGWFIQESGEPSGGGDGKVQDAGLGIRLSITPGGWPLPGLGGREDANRT